MTKSNITISEVEAMLAMVPEHRGSIKRSLENTLRMMRRFDYKPCAEFIDRTKGTLALYAAELIDDLGEN